MILGRVNDRLEAVVKLELRGPDGAARQVEAVIDTGFTGSLTLPHSIIEELGLPWRSRGAAILGNGQIDRFDIHAGTLIWDGRERSVLIEAVQIEPLIGVGLIRGYRLTIDAVIDGAVRIERLEPPLVQR